MVESILIKTGPLTKKEFIDLGIGSDLILFWFFSELEQEAINRIIIINFFKLFLN